MATIDCRNKLDIPQSNQIVDPIWTPFTGHGLAPWIKVWFIGSNFCVSVGNDSMPGGEECEGGGFRNRSACDGQTSQQYTANHAVIKSFKYGYSFGGSSGITVEIIDEQGSEFCNFMTNLFPKNKDRNATNVNDIMAFQFGWITTDCFGNVCTILSRKRKCTPQTVDVMFSPGGIIKFCINAIHPTSIITEGVNNETTIYKTELKPAIEKMFAQYNMTPLFLTAVGKEECKSDKDCFMALKGCTRDNDFSKEVSSYPAWRFFNNEGCNGKLPGAEGFKTNNKDAVVATMAWLQEKATKNKRGFVIGTCNLASNKNPKIIFWESSLPDCDGKSPWSDNIGTYIVNGGECSSVISFTPKFQWTISNKGGGGGLGDASAGATIVGKKGYQICDTSGTGTAERNQIHTTTTDQYYKAAGNITAEAHGANVRANMPDWRNAIEAELVIQGNPDFDDPILAINHEVSILVINPFMLIPPNKGADCTDWLSDPPMNTFLSNRHWLITGMSHEIKEGSFTTTLKLTLPAPGTDLNRTAPLGGPGGPDLSSATNPVGRP